MNKYQSKDKSKKNQFAIIVDDTSEYVDAGLMMKISGLFHRKYNFIISSEQTQEINSIDFSDIKYKRKELLSQFFKICQGQSADINVSEIYYMLLISEEWESPEVSRQLSLFLKSNVDVHDLLIRFSTYIKSRQDVSSFLIDIIASKFKDIVNSKFKEEFIELPPKYICSIIHNPKCEMPQRKILEEFIVNIVNKYGIYCSSLIKYIDLLNTDIKNLYDLNLNDNQYLSAMYPSISRILQLREYENENDRLTKENEKLKKQLKNLRKVDDNE